MNPLTCPEVLDQIDLYAAGECDPPTRDSVAGHLARCPSCARALLEANHLQGLLDLHHRQPDALRRLQARLDAEARPRSPRVLTLRRVASLAAMLLLTFGLALLVNPGRQPTPEPDLAVGLTAPPTRVAAGLPGSREAAKAGHDSAFEKARKEPDRTALLDLHGQSPAAFRAGLRAAPKPPPPPEIDLSLRLSNEGPAPLRLWPEGPGFELHLLVKGPGVLTRTAPAGPTTPGRAVTLGPRESFTLPVRRLAGRSAEGVRYHYWTEPGLYVITARVRMLVAPGDPQADGPVVFGPARTRTFTCPPVTVEVLPKGP